MDDNTELLFSERYASRIAVQPDLTERVFLIHQSKRRLQPVRWAGVRPHFDPELIIHNPDISLAGGAIAAGTG